MNKEGDITSKPRYKWWGYVKNMIRSYPDLVREYNDIHEQPITASISGMPGGGGASRKTEDIAIKQLPRSKQEEYEAVTRAVQVTRMLKTGADRMKIVELVFWKQSHTLQGAAMKVNVSYDTAIDYHGDFIVLAAYFRGLVDYDELPESKKVCLKKP